MSALLPVKFRSTGIERYSGDSTSTLVTKRENYRSPDPRMLSQLNADGGSIERISIIHQ